MLDNNYWGLAGVFAAQLGLSFSPILVDQLVERCRMKSRWVKYKEKRRLANEAASEIWQDHIEMKRACLRHSHATQMPGLGTANAIRALAVATGIYSVIEFKMPNGSNVIVQLSEMLGFKYPAVLEFMAASIVWIAFHALGSLIEKRAESGRWGSAIWFARVELELRFFCPVGELESRKDAKMKESKNALLHKHGVTVYKMATTEVN